MAKFNSKLSKKEVEKYFYQLCIAISEIRNAQEAGELLRDLLSYQEAEMIAKRLKIAESLLKNRTYQEIQDNIKTSPSTIARVQEWLRVSGEGYQKAAQRIRGKEIEKNIETYDYDHWGKMKKRFPSYYWPQILLENIIATSNEKQKQKIRNVISHLNKTKEKNDLYYKIKKLIK